MLASVDNSLVNPETQETFASVDAIPEVSIDVAADPTKKLKPTGPSLSLLTNIIVQPSEIKFRPLDKRLLMHS